MSLVTYRYADVSTVHITYKDSKLLDLHASKIVPFSPIVYKATYGYFVVITNDWLVREWEQIKDAWREFGYSEAFINLHDQCLQEQLQLLRLDSDGAVHADLPRFEWP